jgi:hypothetical protein
MARTCAGHGKSYINCNNKVYNRNHEVTASVIIMATKSFYENLIIDTEEKGQLLLRLFDEADNRPPQPVIGPDIDEILAEGERLIDEGFFKRK